MKNNCGVIVEMRIMPHGSEDRENALKFTFLCGSRYKCINFIQSKEYDSGGYKCSNNPWASICNSEIANTQALEALSGKIHEELCMRHNEEIKK